MYLHLSFRTKKRKLLFLWGFVLLITFILSTVYALHLVHNIVKQHMLTEFYDDSAYLTRQFDELIMHHQASGMLHSVGMISAPVRATVLGSLPPDNLPTLERLQILKDYLGADIIYLMNANGDVVASTTMDEGDVRTLTGNNYSFRPYFKGAIAGKQMIYMALGVTTIKKGVYYSVPVYGEINDRKRPRGVLVAKFSLQFMEQYLNSLPYPAILVSPQNVVFSGNVSDWNGKNLGIDIMTGDKLDIKSQKEEMISCVFDQQKALCPAKEYYIKSYKLPLPEESGQWHLILLSDLKSSGYATASLFTVILIALVHIIAAFSIYFYYHHKRRKRELLRSEALFRDMFERHSSVMLLIDAKTGGIFKANHSVAKYYGYQENELVGMMYEQLNVLSEEELKMIIQQISMNITHDFTCKQRTAEGRVREVEVHANIVKMDDRELIFAITNDITDKKRTEVELIKAKNTAEEAVKIKSEFLANISHEIRTPMNSILGFAELLKQTKLTETQNDYIETLSKSGELLLDTINDVLNFSKLEAGQIFLEEIPFNLEFLLEDVFRVIRAKLVSLPVDNYIDISANVPLNLIGDPTRLRQILMNLLNNSVKFTASGSIGVTVELDDETKDEDNPVLKFCVRDTGVGIPKEKQRLIFEAFTQSESSAVRNYGGAGLGLAICKKIIVALKGSIWVESEFGRGSDFIFKIPFKRGKSAIEQPVYPLSDKALSEVSAGIIDDNPVSQMIHKKYCEDLGIKIAFVSSSAAEALEQMEQIFNKGIIPDILLCDIVMDQMDGYEFGAILRKDDRFKAVKIIAISVDKQVGMARKSQEIGFNGFLSKPISRQHLRSLICTILGDQRESPAIVTKHMAEEMRLKGVRILVAEDNNTNKDLLKAYFNTLGCYGDYTKNGKEFVERFNDAKYDLCIVDVFMPEMGGIEAARIIRTELKSNIPILAITASTNQSDLDKCLSIGINDFLIKPLDLLSLKKKIIQFTGR